MKKPNFFVVGGPKCGTTSIYEWLRRTESVFVTPIKEPHYYNNDISYSKVESKREYRSLFRGANRSHRAVGEASALYLYSDVAVERIEREYDDPKYIVMLRDPVEMAVSLHRENVQSQRESITSFEKAWKLSADRDPSDVSWWCEDKELLNYRKICKVKGQVERLMNQVQEKRVWMSSLNNLKKDSTQEYKSLCNFLGVKTSEITLSKENISNRTRFGWIRKATRMLGDMSREIKKTVGIPVGISTGILTLIQKTNSEEIKSGPLSEQLEEELRDFYNEDITFVNQVSSHQN